MALIQFGESTCVICDEVITEEDRPGNVLGFPAFGPPPPWSYKGPHFSRFNDACVHRACFVEWPQRDELVRYVNAALGRPLLLPDGTWAQGRGLP